jgi:hypothetical protein
MPLTSQSPSRNFAPGIRAVFKHNITRNGSIDVSEYQSTSRVLYRVVKRDAILLCRDGARAGFGGNPPFMKVKILRIS